MTANRHSARPSTSLATYTPHIWSVQTIITCLLAFAVFAVFAKASASAFAFAALLARQRIAAASSRAAVPAASILKVMLSQAVSGIFQKI